MVRTQSLVERGRLHCGAVNRPENQVLAAERSAISLPAVAPNRNAIEYLPADLRPIGLLEVVPQQHLTLRIRHRTFFALKFHAIRAIFGAVTCNNNLDSWLE